MKALVFGSRNNDLGVANPIGDKAANLWQLDFMAQIIPNRAAKNALVFQLVNVCVCEDGIGHTRKISSEPSSRRLGRVFDHEVILGLQFAIWSDDFHL